jgi:hypothetical protein
MAYSSIMPKPILIKCPSTGLSVQHWLPDAPGDKRTAIRPVSAGLCQTAFHSSKEAGFQKQNCSEL